MKTLRNIVRNAVAGIGLSLSLLASAMLVAPFAYAQVAPSTTTIARQPVPRQFPTEQTHYIRSTFAWNSCTNTPTTGNQCGVKLMNASLPYNAAVLRVTAYVYTAFNSTSSDVIIVGTTAANSNEIVTSTCNIHAVGVVACTVLAGSPNNLGNTVTQSGKNGGLDIYMNWTGGGGTPSAGLMSLIIEYAAPNDGLCAAVALGAAPAGC
jgi:hypothetical protein